MDLRVAPEHEEVYRRIAVQTRRRRLIVTLCSLFVLLVAIAYVATSLAWPVPHSVAVETRQLSLSQSAADIQWPAFGGGAIEATDYPGVDVTHGATTSMPIASMTKTITALMVLKAHPIAPGGEGATITFTQNDVEIWKRVIQEGGSWAPVVAGSQMTEKQALTAMLLPSANNYAISLATWAYGSVAGYLTATQQWLTAQGLIGTRITDPSGLDPGSVSDTADLVKIGRLVMASPTLTSIVNLKEANLPGAGVQKNTNGLLGEMGIDGIKTGNTAQAGYCLMFAADLSIGSSTVTVVGTVLDAPDHASLFAAVRALVASVKKGFHEVTLTRAGQVFGTYTTPWGTTAALVAEKPATTLVWSNAEVTTRVRTRSLGIAAAGTKVGTVTFSHGTTSVTVNLRLSQAILDPGLWWRIGHPLWLHP